jgi:hypothetical protein
LRWIHTQIVNGFFHRIHQYIQFHLAKFCNNIGTAILKSENFNGILRFQY